MTQKKRLGRGKFVKNVEMENEEDMEIIRNFKERETHASIID